MPHSKTLTNQRACAEILLLLVALSWAAGFIMMKLAVSDESVWHVLWIRFAVACLIILPFCRRHLLTGIRLLLTGALLGIILFFSFALLISGLKVTTTSNTGFLSGLSVVWVPAILHIVFKQGISSRTIAGIGLSLGGIFLLSGGQLASFNQGDWLVIAGSLFIAIHIIAIDKLAHDKPPAELTLIQLLTVTTLSALASITNGPLLPDAMPLRFTTLVSATAILSTAVAFLVQTKFQAYTSPTRAAVIFSIEPVLSASLAWLILGEQIGTPALLGGLLVVVGMCSVESDSAT